MGELDAGDSTLRFDVSRDAGPGGDVLVLPDAGAAGSNAAFRANGGGFGDDGTGADGPGAQVNEVPIGGETIDGGLLAHRRDEDAIIKRHAAQR